MLLFRILCVLLILIKIGLSVVMIPNLGYQCKCVLPGNCDDDELSYGKKFKKIPRRGDGHHHSEDDIHLLPNVYPRIQYDGDERCEGGTEECCSAVKPPPTYFSDPSFGVKPNCGIQKLPRTSSTGVATRITGNSQITFFGELPWNLLILDRHKKENDASYRYGASLIHPKVALTAAHCVVKFQGYEKQIIVRAGEWDLSNEYEPHQHQESGIDEILVHPEYAEESLRNDIALLFLKAAFVLDPNVATICLSRTDLPGLCTVSGWGKGGGLKTNVYSHILRKIEVPIVPREICARKVSAIAPGKRFNLHESFVCAGGERYNDACKGDGGSPMVCWSHQYERFVQIGIVSWGGKCGRGIPSQIPGIYVNVVLYLDWIDNALLSRDLDVSFYKIAK